MAMLSPKFDDLTIGHDFLFKKVMRNPSQHHWYARKYFA